mmetsp:Transcript_83944/g.271246  ORF Transcript_83944/g.271246 Transcript_83944/m.271246 type:complete len:332 (-) Transcript_83944:291-1286(-)
MRCSGRGGRSCRCQSWSCSSVPSRCCSPCPVCGSGSELTPDSKESPNQGDSVAELGEPRNCKQNLQKVPDASYTMILASWQRWRPCSASAAGRSREAGGCCTATTTEPVRPWSAASRRSCWSESRSSANTKSSRWPPAKRTSKPNVLLNLGLTFRNSPLADAQVPEPSVATSVSNCRAMHNFMILRSAAPAATMPIATMSIGAAGTPEGEHPPWHISGNTHPEIQSAKLVDQCTPTKGKVKIDGKSHVSVTPAQESEGAVPNPMPHAKLRLKRAAQKNDKSANADLLGTSSASRASNAESAHRVRPVEPKEKDTERPTNLRSMTCERPTSK